MTGVLYFSFLPDCVSKPALDIRITQVSPRSVVWKTSIVPVVGDICPLRRFRRWRRAAQQADSWPQYETDREKGPLDTE